ncbi:hypothetical protein BCV70DRAFT_200547 [Testicularia cyperi]|uniref:Uncharacterized protein n=1 Tax=Testicularia cyperi TaxID=1882483 RepID=A0A317XMR5_9BASI|nr:hypothetical protein BCV70DRAFT_200547 [Testicularia cyperi]
MSPFAGRAPGYANTQQHQAAFHHSQRQSPLLSPAFEHLEGGLQGGDWRNSHSHSGMQPSARGWSQDELAAYSRQETLAKARGLNFSFQTSNASTGLGLVEQAQGGVRQTSASAGTDADSERVSPPYLHPHAGSSGTAKKPSALGGRRESGKSLRAVSDPMPQGFSTSNGRHQHRRNVISSSSKAQSWRRGSIGVGLDARRVAVSADNSLDLGRVDDDYDHENEAEIEIGIEASVGDDSTTSRTAPDAINTTQLISHHRPRPRTSQSSGNSIDIDNSHPLIGSESGCDEEDDDDEKDDHDSEGDNSIEIQINPSSGSGFGHSHGATFSTSGKNGTFTLLPIRTPSLPTL